MILYSHRTISRALTELRSEGGPELDLQALAEQAQIPVERICQLDMGQPGLINIAELERLCCILGRSPNDLLGYEPDL